MLEIRELANLLREILGERFPNERRIRLVLAVDRILGGESLAGVAKLYRLTPRALEAAADEVRRVGISALIPDAASITPDRISRAKEGIARILLGVLAEKRFEEIARGVTGEGVIRVEDHRPSRTDTDYRLLNGSGQPICRLNIKFHGTAFRDALRYVGLDPRDCFPLAAYKIRNALTRQEQDGLPYVFLVLSVLDLDMRQVAALVSEDYARTLTLIGTYRLEEEIVERLRSGELRQTFEPITSRMTEGQFRVVSAQKAYNLLKDKLFDRVHALSIPGFTRKFRNAEIDMHLSISHELTPVRRFLELLTQLSHQEFAVRLYRGDL
jgi:hypothetical protein